MIIQEEVNLNRGLSWNQQDLLRKLEKFKSENQIFITITKNQCNLLREQRNQIEQLKQENRKLHEMFEDIQAQNRILRQTLFGNKSEQSKNSIEETCSQNSSEQKAEHIPSKKRGQQHGVKGHGRKKGPEDIPVEEVEYDLLPEQKKCPVCGKPYFCFPHSEDSEEIDYKVIIRKIVHKRKKYASTCHCEGKTRILTAPGPFKLIPKGKYSVSFWVEILLQHYGYQIPVHRLKQRFELEGLFVPQGTLCGGLQFLEPLFQPLYKGILQRAKESRHWHMDESGWRVYILVEGKRKRWWLWVVVTKEVCIFIINSSRSRSVPKAFFDKNQEGILNVDRYEIYSEISPFLILAYCWSHLKRDFIRVGQGYPELKEWAYYWEQRVNHIFELNRVRVKRFNAGLPIIKEEENLWEKLHEMESKFNEELNQMPELHRAKKKALKSFKKRWSGYCVFMKHPLIPMDNNAAERAIRNPVCGRKNYYGNGSLWSSHMHAMMFSLLQTLKIQGLNWRTYLVDYLNECSRLGGKAPPDINRFLPWKASKEDLDKWKKPFL